MNEPHYRHEFKYLVSEAQVLMLKNRLSSIMSSDRHAGDNGTYSIRSLYFDNYENSCYYDNENGVEPREKYRIRIYNHSKERVVLECKRKEHGMTLKTSCRLSDRQMFALTQNSRLERIDLLPPLLQKLELKRKTELMRPVVIVEYDRTPFVYKDGNVRVTFDRNITSGAYLGNFLDETISCRPVMPAGQCILEVKYDSFLPDMIYQSLNLGCLRQTTYSKYYLCRKLTLR